MNIEQPMQNNSTSNKNVISQSQKILRSLSRKVPSIPPVTIDGIIDEETTEAIKQFQIYMALPETGILDIDTFYALTEAGKAIEMIDGISAPIFPFERRLVDKKVSVGDNFDLVMILQIMLQSISISYDTLPFLVIDGYYGENTMEAVIEFQRINSLPVTGSVDIFTWNRLARVYQKYIDSEGE